METKKKWWIGAIIRCKKGPKLSDFIVIIAWSSVPAASLPADNVFNIFLATINVKKCNRMKIWRQSTTSLKGNDFIIGSLCKWTIWTTFPLSSFGIEVEDKNCDTSWILIINQGMKIWVCHDLSLSESFNDSILELLMQLKLLFCCVFDFNNIISV